MAKKAKRKVVQKAPESSLERTRRETKIRLQREVRLEKQIALLSRTVERLVRRRHANLRDLRNFLDVYLNMDEPDAHEKLETRERLNLAHA